MTRTPDWCLYAIADTARLCKPRIVLEVGDAQPLARYRGAGRRENLRDRAVTWLTTSYGITKVVILVNLARRNGMVDCDGVQRQWVTSIGVTVEMWRMIAAIPTCVAQDRFIVKEHDDEPEPEGGLVLMAEDVYDPPMPHTGDFLLEYAWLKMHLVRVWPLARGEWVDGFRAAQ